jgi:hypothetical protein
VIDTVASLNLWIPQVQGQYINEDWNPTNKGFGAQCWDLVAHWSKSLGLPVINTGYDGRWIGWAGNMVDAYPQTPEIAAAYELIGPDQQGLPGDIVVWGDSYWYYPATHVAVLVADKGAQLVCMSQNSTPSQAANPYPAWSSGPTTIQSLPRQGLIGFLRPRTTINLASAIITQLEEAGMALDDNDRSFINTVGDRVLLDNRAHTEHWGKQVIETVKNSEHEVKLFTQQVDNENTDRAIIDARAQEAITRSELKPEQVADLVPAELAQAVIDALVKKLEAN